jgi:lambda family phage portal protein
MLDRLKKLVASPPATPTRAPSQPSTAIVPVHRALPPDQRPQTTMGYLDRNPDSPRPIVGMSPRLRTADEEIRQAWHPVAAHARHVLTQSGFLQYGVELSTAWTVGGDGLGLNLTPDHESLGWSADYANDWARAVEQSFAEWSNDRLAADTQGRMKFGAVQGAALKSFLATGDILAVLNYGEKQGTWWKSSVTLLDPARLATPPIWNQPGSTIRDGIEFDVNGRALAYHIRGVGGRLHGQTLRIPRFGDGGKELVFHGFDGEAGTIRGISPLGAAIAAILQTQNVADAAVMAAHIAAMVVGVVTSDLPSDVVARSIGGEDGNPLTAMMSQRVSWHETLKKAGAHLTLGNGAKIAHLSTGERFEMRAGKESFSAYEPILKMGLREAARALGLAPEHLDGDKSQATYSSIRVATAEAFDIIQRRRKILIEPLNEWALAHVVEEAIARDDLPFPAKGFRSSLDAFRARKAYALKCQWRGPAPPTPDELKSARAAGERVRTGLSSLSDEIASTGRDPEAVFRQRKVDEAFLKELGLELPWPPVKSQPKGGAA